MQNEVYVFLPAVSIKRIGCINQVEKDIIPESLEGRDGKRLGYEQRREGVRACDAECQHLPKALRSVSSPVRSAKEYSPKQENDPEVPRLQICEPACLALFDLVWCLQGCSLRLSVYRRRAARGQAFTLIFDWRDLLNC